MNQITDPLVEKRQIATPIFVAPTLGFPGHDDSECTNGGPGIAQVETWAAVDVPEFVRAHFRVRPDRSSWATLGYSFGGYCSALITMLHPKSFGSAIILGGYFRPTFPGALPYPRDGVLARRYDLIALAKTKPPAVAMYVQTGPMDTPSWPTCREFFDAVRAPTSVTKIVDPTAGHRGSVWSAYLPKSLAWLGATAPGFAPAP